MRSLLLIPVLIIMLAACKHDDDKYKEFLESWQEKAQKLRANPIPQKVKSLEREKVQATVLESKDQEKQLPQITISVKYYQQDLGTVLRALGKLAGLNIIVDDSLTQMVTMELNDVPWIEVFSGLLDSYSLDYTYENNIVRIITPQSIRKKLETETIKEQLNQAKQRVKKSSPLSMRTVKIDHLNVEKTAELMKKLLSEEKTGSDRQFRGSVEVDKETNTIIINAVAEDINKMLKLVEKLDRPAVQVLIEAQIVVTDQRTARELGMQWGGLFKLNNHSWVIPGNDASGILGGTLDDGGNPISGPISNFPISSQSGDSDEDSNNGLNIGIGYADSNMILQAQLSALEESGQAHIVSSPTITTLNNVQAFIESGSEIPYQTTNQNQGTTTEFKKAVLRLEVTPHVVDNALIKLDVEANNDEPDKTITNKDLEPAITTRKTKTTVLLQNGQTTVIAGLSKEFTSEGKSGIPILKDLPYLGYLFRSSITEKEMSDLLIFITPYIIEPNGNTSSIPEATTPAEPLQKKSDVDYQQQENKDQDND